MLVSRVRAFYSLATLARPGANQKARESGSLVCARRVGLRVNPGGGCSSGGRACVRQRRLLGMSYVAMSEVNLHAQKMLITLNSLPRRPETGNPET